MAVDRSVEDVFEVGIGLDAIELGGGDERTDRCPSDGSAIGPSEEMILAPECHHPVILPISAGKSRSITAGTRYRHRVRQHYTEQYTVGHIVHVEIAPGVVVAIAAWMLDSVACAKMEYPHRR